LAVIQLTKGIGVTWLRTMGEGEGRGRGREGRGGGGKNRSWVLGTLIYKEVNSERWGIFVP